MYILDRFLLRVRNTVLPRRLEDWWRYSIEITHKGILLCMEHIHSAFVNEDETKYGSEVVDQIFPLVFIPAQMLTVDEYAKLYEVEPVTVRQWIRRCKLRAVEKAGKEWRISELADIPRRGFEGVQYRWRAELPDVPEEFSYINSYKLLTLLATIRGKFQKLNSGAYPGFHDLGLYVFVDTTFIDRAFRSNIAQIMEEISGWHYPSTFHTLYLDQVYLLCICDLRNQKFRYVDLPLEMRDSIHTGIEPLGCC